MTKRILFHGAPARTYVTNATPSDTALQMTGGNTGNLLIGAALESQLEGTGRFFELRFSPPPPEQAKEEFDLIAIPASNFLFRGFDFGYIGDFIEKTDLPCVVVGIGAQAQDRTMDVEVPEGTRRFLKIAAERTTLIGARGIFTAEVLHRIGIRNVEVTGCPSLYPLQRPPAMTIPDQLPDPTHLVLNGSRNVVEHSFDPETMLAVERAIFSYAIKNNVDYVLQSEIPEIFFPRKLGEANDSQLTALRRFWNISQDCTDEALREYAESRFKVFFHLSEWANFTREKKLSIGSRFHGNVMTMTNGIPTILITHDTRTEEMAEHIGMPRHRPKSQKEFSMDAIIQEASADEFNAIYPIRRRDYIKFLEKNGLSHKFAS